MQKLKEKTSIDFKTKQKNECLERLLILKEKGLLRNVVDDFKRNKLLYYSEQTKLGGILYWLTKDNRAERFENIVNAFEKENNAIVYHVIHCYTDFRRIA